MDQQDIAALMKGIAPVMRETIERAMQPVIQRLLVLEAREPRQGEPGPPGKDGRDGQGLTDIAVSQDGAILELAFQVGDARSVYEVELPAGPSGVDGRDAYPGEARGLYDPAAEYRALDCVSLNGSEWRAKRDNPGPLPGDGWMLSSMRGKRGDRGEKGERGTEGLPGLAGASPIALGFDPQKMTFEMTLDNGEQLEADFYPVAKAIRGDEA